MDGSCHLCHKDKSVLFSVCFSEETRTGQHQAMFCLCLYVRPWFVANVTVSAPANDLEFTKRLVSYEDKSISKAAGTAFSRYLWYLSEIMISLAFFDPAHVCPRRETWLRR